MKFCIYKIYDKNCNDIFYIGYTNNFNRRKCSHKKSTTNKKSKKYKLKLYTYIRECGGWDNFVMEVIEYVEDRIIGLKREKELILELKPQLNVMYFS